MSTLDLRTIRPIRGSANNGFEEVCCQLAACEEPALGSRFIRNGTPDGGVESYWVLPDGSEHGWQAKYFFELENSQWSQLDDSVRTALATHPKLTRYTICLPFDLPDGRQDPSSSRQIKTLREKWNERVQRWEAEAGGKRMAVAFELWGESALLTRLTLDGSGSGRSNYPPSGSQTTSPRSSPQQSPGTPLR
jgi:hypothetical protein